MLFDPLVHTLIAQSSIPEFSLDQDANKRRYYIPARWLSLAAHSNTTIILPKLSAIEAQAAFLQETLCRWINAKLTILYTSDKSYLLDQDIEDSLISELTSITKSHAVAGRKTKIIAYRANAQFLAWTKKLELEDYVGDSEVFIKNFGNKCILHRHIRMPYTPTVLEEFDVLVHTAKGYVCESRSDVELAFEKLRSVGVDEMLIKPARGTSGKNILKISSLSDISNYPQVQDQLILEECLPLDVDSKGNEINCSLQFIGDDLLGDPTLQLMDKTSWQGNTVPNNTPSAFVDSCVQQSKSMLKALKQLGLQGPGGFDFVSAKDKAFLVDPNIGRFTGAHIPKYLVDYLAPGSAWATLQMPHHQSSQQVWEKLIKHRIAYNHDTHSGVYPFCHLEGIWSMHIAIASTGEEAIQLIREARLVLG